VSSTHLGLTFRFLFLSDRFWFVDVGRSFWWICHLQLLRVLASAVILGFEFRGTRDHILLSQIWDSHNLEGQVPIFISPRNRMSRLYPQALGSLFIASYDSQGYGGGIRIHLHASSNTAPLDCCTTVTTIFNTLSRDTLFTFVALTDCHVCCSCSGAVTLFYFAAGGLAPGTWSAWGRCCCRVLLRSGAAKETPGVLRFEENTIPVVVLVVQSQSYITTDGH
jgi:hypothetical protein